MLLLPPLRRLFKYDRANNVSKVLLDELFFANGVALSTDEDFVVVAETGASRLTKYYLMGPKAGQSEVFVDGLPGHPDNITPDADGMWVPLVGASDKDHPTPFAMFAHFPNIRLFLSRLLKLFELFFQLLNKIFPNALFERLGHILGRGENSAFLWPRRSTVVRVDWNGHIVGSLHGFDKSPGPISHVLQFQDYLLLGSPLNTFLARVKLPKPKKQPETRNSNKRYEGSGRKSVVKPLAHNYNNVKPFQRKQKQLNVINKQAKHTEL